MVGELIMQITYADALSKEEANDLINKNEESVRITAVAINKIYLVNIIPMRTFISRLIILRNHLRPISQVHPCLGTRCRVPTVGWLCEGLKQQHSQWTLGEGPQGYRGLISLYLNCSQVLVGLWDSSS
jgi:hypothetical protein